MAPRANSQAGFTLLEVLVALVVLSLLTLGLQQGVHAGIALRQAQTQRLRETADLDAVTRLLRALLTRLPLAPGGNGVIPAADGSGFKGEQDRVSFVGNLPNGLGASRLAEMSLAVHDHRLVLNWKPHRHEQRSRTEPVQTELLRGVERLELAYWGTPGKNMPGAWQAHWEGLESPVLIRMRFVFNPHDRRAWPSLTIAARP